jgi:lysozyme family protein
MADQTFAAAIVPYLMNMINNVEGGYSDNPSDSGGPTIWGITETEARAHGYTGDMHDLSQSFALSIYTTRYVSDPRFDLIGAIDCAIGLKLVDTGVNMGPSQSAMFLQRALNVLGMQGQLYPKLTVDGSAATLTRGALTAFITKRGSDGRKVLLNMLRAQQSVDYMTIAEANPTQETFEYGWQLNRSFA